MLKIKVNEKIYVRDPQETDLGRRILTEGSKLMDELGMEKFTFKKLAERIDSTEASVYRYFENKNKFLIYLTSWYWIWLDTQLNERTQEIENPKEKFTTVINVITEVKKNPESLLDEVLIARIVLTEGIKSYLTKDVDELNKDGNYREYKKFCQSVASIILEVNPAFPFAISLASTLMEAAHQQKYFSQHLPSLTNIGAGEDSNLQNYLNKLIRIAEN